MMRFAKSFLGLGAACLILAGVLAGIGVMLDGRIAAQCAELRAQAVTAHCPTLMGYMKAYWIFPGIVALAGTLLLLTGMLSREATGFGSDDLMG